MKLSEIVRDLVLLAALSVVIFIVYNGKEDFWNVCGYMQYKETVKGTVLKMTEIKYKVPAGRSYTTKYKYHLIYEYMVDGTTYQVDELYYADSQVSVLQKGDAIDIKYMKEQCNQSLPLIIYYENISELGENVLTSVLVAVTLVAVFEVIRR